MAHDETIADAPEDEEDWFGEGSMFDSADGLASALFAMAGVDAPEVQEAPAGSAAWSDLADDPHDGRSAPQVFEEFPRAVIDPGHRGGSQPATEWIPIPSSAGSGPAGGPSHGPVPTRSTWTVRAAKDAIAAQSGTQNQWSIRSGVRMLKLTEDVMERLRADAVDVTWAAAAIAVAQAPKRRRIRKGEPV